MASLDALGMVFGDGWPEGARCITGMPLSVGCSLYGAALRGLSLAQWQACVGSVGKLPYSGTPAAAQLCATPASSLSCLWVRPRRRRCAARPGSGVLLELSIICTPRLRDSSANNDVRKQAEEDYTQSSRR